MLTLAFDTATAVPTVAVVRDGEVLGERRTRAVALLDRDVAPPAPVVSLPVAAPEPESAAEQLDLF